MYNNELHNAIIDKDIQAIEVILDQFTKEHLNNYDFILCDSNTFIDIEYVYAEHDKELKEFNDDDI